MCVKEDQRPKLISRCQRVCSGAWGGLEPKSPLALKGHDACLAIVHMDHVSLLVQDRHREPFPTDDVPRRTELAVQLVLNHLRGRLNHKEMEGGGDEQCYGERG